MEEESLLMKKMGFTNPLMRVLDFLMDNESFDYSKRGMAMGAGISKPTMAKAWPALEELDLIVLTRLVGTAKMYRLNKQSPIVKKLMELDNVICEYMEAKMEA